MTPRERVAVGLRLIERRDRPPVRVVLIASIPRSGSNLLCRGLAASGAVGQPYEALNSADILRTARRWGTPSVRPWNLLPSVRQRQLAATRHLWYPFDGRSLRRYLLMVARRRQSPNGVFAMKIHGEHLAHTMEHHGIGTDVWGAPVTWIRIGRHDLVAQAVSLTRASQTRQFLAHQRAVAEPHYDAAAIRTNLQRIEDETAYWDHYFATIGDQPIEVWYEDLAADPQGELRRILDALGYPDAPAPPAQIPRQGDQLNRDWIERFLAEDHGSTHST